MEIDPKDIGSFDFKAEEDTFQEGTSNQTDDGDDSADECHSPGKKDKILLESAHQSPLHHLAKWKRLKGSFSDQYLEYFNEHCSGASYYEGREDLRETQLGAVIWVPDEKEKLFGALARLGRHQLTMLSEAIGTKSPVEILAYIDAVHEAHVDRQYFQENTKNVSLAAIPAAVEVHYECESAIEKAADALNAYQEQYDITTSLNEKGADWLIDRGVALRLDTEARDHEIDSDAQANLDISTEEDAHVNYEKQKSQFRHLFNLSAMLDLSEQLFMNHSEQSRFPHWKDIAEPEQRPSITEDCLETFSELVYKHTQRILKVAIQIAQVRLSSTTTNSYVPSHKVSQLDIATALDILSTPHDSWNFWTGLARRNHLRVITGSHDKGEMTRQVLSYEDVEAFLMPRRGRKRRRSMSTGSDVSSAESDHSDNTALAWENGDDDVIDNNGIDEENYHSDADNSKISAEDSDEAEEETNMSVSSSTVESVSHGLATTETGISHEQRKMLLEEALSNYVENVDRVAAEAEEKRLWQVLGKRSRAADEEEEEEHKLGNRPKVLRKPANELSGWSCVFMADWEHTGRPLQLMESFVDSEVGQETSNTDGEAGDIK